MKTIDELWYGNISLFEQCAHVEKRLRYFPDALTADKAAEIILTS